MRTINIACFFCFTVGLSFIKIEWKVGWILFVPFGDFGFKYWRGWENDFFLFFSFLFYCITCFFIQVWQRFPLGK